MGVRINLFQCVLFVSVAPLFSQAKIEFFGYENFQRSLYSVERITTSCETLPRSHQNKANSIKTDTCIILYSNEFCVGSFVKVETGEHPLLPYFKNQVESYRACNDVSKNEPWRDVRIKLYQHYRSNEMLWDTPITPECVTLPLEFGNQASALNADLCVILFSQPHCIGEQYQVESAGYDKDLYDFNDVTNSFMPCNASDVYKRPIPEPEGRVLNESVTTPVLNNNIKSRAEFFRYDDFGGIPYTVEMVTTSCVTLPENIWHETSSIKTEGCIILYEFGLCRGSYFIVQAGDHANLPYFRNRAVSYRACSDVRKNQTIQPLSPDGPRIQFFDHCNYIDMMWDAPINPNCTTLPEKIRNKTSSLKSDMCVILFSDANCVGSQFLVHYFLWDNSLEYFQDKLVSFMPCNAGDILNKSVVVTATTKLPSSVESFPSAIIKVNAVTKPHELFKSHHIENPVSDDSSKIQYHSGNKLMSLVAIAIVVGVRFLAVVTLALLTTWICFMHRNNILRILKLAWHGNNIKADDEMGDIGTPQQSSC